MKCDPWFDAAGVRLCIDPAAATATAAAGAVSTIRVYTRWIHADGAELRVGAIGDVATATSHRRRGLAGQCIRDAIECAAPHHPPTPRARLADPAFWLAFTVVRVSF